MARSRRIAIAATLALALAGCGASKSASTTTAPVKRSEPIAVAPAQLPLIARSVGHPIYWATGTRGHALELTRASDGSVYLRYLPRGTRLGAPGKGFLTIGTYPVSDAFGLASRAAAQRGAVVDHLAGGGLAVAPAAHPTSVYVAYPGAVLLVEVYDPAPSFAHLLVRAGRVTAVAPAH